jgi:isopenicillin N synthase-like dioxygenase
MVMNIGDMAEIWSNGRWRSTRHRVVSPDKLDRYSIPFFFDPDFNTTVEPLLESEQAITTKYLPTHYGNYLMHRLDKNYTYRDKST